MRLAPRIEEASNDLVTCLNRLGPRVAEKYPVGKGVLDQSLAELFSLIDSVEVRGVPERIGLLC